MSGEHIAPELLRKLRKISVGPTVGGDSGLVLIEATTLHACVRALEQRPVQPSEQVAAARKLDQALARMERQLAKKTGSIDAARKAAAELALAINGNTSQ